MRVLMLSWEYPPHLDGGMGKHVAALAPALVRLGVDVHVVTPMRKEGETAATVQRDVTVHRVELASWATGDIMTDAYEANRRITSYAETLVRNHGSFDLIHAHDWLVALSAFHFKHEYKWPLIATIHATERGRRGGTAHGPLSASIDQMEWRLCFETWRIIVTSQFMEDQITDYFDLPPGKVDVIPNGVDVSHYQALEEEDLTAFRRRFAADGERIVFHVGRLVYEKGAQTLVAAAPSILSEFPNTRFVIAGRGPMRAELESIASNMGAADRFSFAGYISDEDRDRLYTVADVAVFPSLYEPFGIVALEAMAAGVPVVASSAGGLGEVVDMHETGLTHYSGNPESLAWAVRETFRHPDQAQTRTENAREKIQRMFTWDHIARQTVQVYEQVVEERQDVDW